VRSFLSFLSDRPDAIRLVLNLGPSGAVFKGFFISTCLDPDHILLSMHEDAVQKVSFACLTRANTVPASLPTAFTLF